MGNSNNSLFQHKNGENFEGENTTTRNDLTYKGQFVNGEFVKGAILDSNNNELENGEFVNGELVRGTKAMKLVDILNGFIFTFDVNDDLDFNFIVYAVGQFEDGLLDGNCSVYYDVEHTRKCIVGDFEDGILVEGEIFNNDDANSTLEKGFFADSLTEGVVTRSVVNPIYCDNENDVNDEFLDLYEKITESDNNITEYYYDTAMKNKAMVCDVVDDVINGECIYYSKSGQVLFSGLVLGGSAIHGILYYLGSYTHGHIDAGLPHGDTKVYENLPMPNQVSLNQASLDNKVYAEGYYSHGKPVGWIKYYSTDCTHPTKKVLYDVNGNKIDEVTGASDNETAFDKWLRTKFVDHNCMDQLTTETKKLKNLHKTVTNRVKKFPSVASYAVTFMSVLDEYLENDKQNSKFAADLKTAIHNEFVKYCEFSKKCGVLDDDQYDRMTKMYNAESPANTNQNNTA